MSGACLLLFCLCCLHSSLFFTPPASTTPMLSPVCQSFYVIHQTNISCMFTMMDIALLQLVSLQKKWRVGKNHGFCPRTKSGKIPKILFFFRMLRTPRSTDACFAFQADLTLISVFSQNVLILLATHACVLFSRYVYDETLDRKAKTWMMWKGDRTKINICIRSVWSAFSHFAAISNESGQIKISRSS